MHNFPNATKTVCNSIGDLWVGLYIIYYFSGGLADSFDGCPLLGRVAAVLKALYLYIFCLTLDGWS